MSNVGKNIVALRKQHKMTQDELAAALFVTRQTVSNYETGRSKPDIDMLIKIAEVFGTNVDEVIYGPAKEKLPFSRKHLIIALSALAALVLVHIILGPIAYNYQTRYYIVGPQMIIRLIVEPAIFLLFGWLLLQILAIIFKFKPLQKEWVPAVRKIVLILFGALALFMLILVIYFCISPDNFSIPYIPIIYPLLLWIFELFYNCPYITFIFGLLFWIFNFPQQYE